MGSKSILPSNLALPSTYRNLEAEKFAFHRPPLPQSIPLSLLHRTFGQFVENVKVYEPTATENALVHKLRQSMSIPHNTENDLCASFRDILVEHYPEIQLEPANIGATKYYSDGHCKVREFIILVEEGKLLGTSNHGDPEVQACGYYLTAIRNLFGKRGDLNDLCPCMIIYIHGKLLDQCSGSLSIL